jgi:endonuclease/exonuclease/phosphatase (EEP) superfamily protein YafD
MVLQSVLLLFKRLIGFSALAYLPVMLVYLILRFTVQDRNWFVAELNTFAILLFIPLPILLTLSLLVRSRTGLLLLSPVMLIVAIWIGPRFLPKNPAAHSPVLRVMSNNISHFNIDPDRVPQIAQSQNPDVIFLQEVLIDEHQSALNALDVAYPYQTRQYDQMRQYMYNAYNITYSRYPFVISEQVDPQISLMPQIYRNVIEVDGQRIALYNIHLLSPGGERRLTRVTRFFRLTNNYFVRYALSYDDSIRNLQIEALLSFLATEPYPYIVAGDFNTSDFSMTYNRLASAMHDSFAEGGVGLGSSWPAVRALGYPAFIPPIIRIDYIWHSAGLQTVSAWKGDFSGSDHLPMFADFALSP